MFLIRITFTCIARVGVNTKIRVFGTKQIESLQTNCLL